MTNVPNNERPNDERSKNNNPNYGIHNKQYGATIGDVMDWFKTMTTNAYIRGVKNNDWMRFDGKLWQRNYHDHIIRNGDAYQKILEYIINNPAKWNGDTFNCEQ
ncbi:MAG: transposase [Bacteroidales bacterium]|nr:transposase [Bacteroidales bacterium]